MKRDCAYTRKLLRKYLKGHLFKYEQVRIGRHLNACAVCRSEFQALKKIADTRQLLKEITPPEGLGRRMKDGVSGLAKLKLLLYRPLWLAVMIAAGTALYFNVIVPLERDIEIENIEKSLPPPGTLASNGTITPDAGSSAPGTARAKQARKTIPARPEAKPDKKAAAPAPLVITILPEDDTTAVERINEVMQEHGRFGKKKFSKTSRKISGSLTAEELDSFFNTIRHSAKVSYSRKRFKSFPAALPIPVILRMKPAPKRASEPPPSPEEQAPDGSLPVSAPTLSGT